MSVIHCPNCQTALRLEPLEGPAVPAAHGALGRRELRAAFELMELVGPGRWTFQELWDTFQAKREGENWAELTKIGLAKALSRNGATAWRRSDARGWEIPQVGEKPAKPLPSVLEREDARDYRNTVIHYGSGAARVERERAAEQPVASVPAPEDPEEKERRIRKMLGL